MLWWSRSGIRQNTVWEERLRPRPWAPLPLRTRIGLCGELDWGYAPESAPNWIGAAPPDAVPPNSPELNRPRAFTDGILGDPTAGLVLPKLV